MVIVFHFSPYLWYLGALYPKIPRALDKPKSSWIFNFVLALIHALAEVQSFFTQFKINRKYVLCSICTS